MTGWRAKHRLLPQQNRHGGGRGAGRAGRNGASGAIDVLQVSQRFVGFSIFRSKMVGYGRVTQ